MWISISDYDVYNENMEKNIWFNKSGNGIPENPVLSDFFVRYNRTAVKCGY